MQYVRHEPSRILFGFVYAAIWAMLIVTLARRLSVGVLCALPCVRLPKAAAYGVTVQLLSLTVASTVLNSVPQGCHNIWQD